MADYPVMKTMHVSLRKSTLTSLALLLAAPAVATAQIDNFDDGMDEGWIRFSALDVVGVSSIFSFPDNGNGKAYRMQSPAPPVPDAGPARTFTYREDIYSDFYAGVDIADWNNDVNQAFGIFFRATEVGLGQTLGYVLNYDPQQASGGRGQIQFNIVTNEADQGTIGAANISFEPGRQYRIVMRAEGTRFSADVYDLNDLTSPLTSYWGTDELYPSGAVGLFNFYRGGDTINPDAGIADTTFDNYTVAAENNLVPAPGAWRGIEGWPHVLSLVPLNRTAFHPAENGIQFTVSSLDEQAVSADRVQLLINGSDITSQTTFTSAGSELQVASGPLAVNTVYDAEIRIATNDGQTAITEWTFDTFTQSYLASDEVHVIELEDYNFDGGQFLDNPPVSGFLENGSGVNATTGYVDREGIPDIDFFDYETSPDDDESKIVYRPFDPVATQAGASETGSAAQFSGPDPAVNDFIREQYQSVDLPEFQITNTEGGEWLNYTRTFAEGDYHVYLRGAGRATQEIHLDQVTSAATEPDQSTTRLGTFTLPNMGMEFNYRFVPLQTADGNPAVVSLSGTQTVRLTIGSEQENRTNETTALNYLAFVPAPEIVEPAVQVTVASDVSGPYSAASNAQVDENTITVPIEAAQGFIAISANGAAITILSVTAQDGNIVIRYQL